MPQISLLIIIKLVQIICRSPFQAEISYKNDTVQIVGSARLIAKMNALKIKFGNNPVLWNLIEPTKSLDDLLINEFILKCQGQFKFAYEHTELCHCRMVPTDRVFEAIKQGCCNIEEIGRSTLAGTGCGSCRDDMTLLLNQFKIS